MKTVNIKNISPDFAISCKDYIDINNLYIQYKYKKRYYSLEIKRKDLIYFLQNIWREDFLNLMFYINNLFKEKEIKIIWDLQDYYYFFDYFKKRYQQNYKENKLIEIEF